MINIKLSAEQLALLLQVFDEQLSIGTIEPSEVAIAEEVLAILESAENKAYANTHYFS
jgi:hypothetical protein